MQLFTFGYLHGSAERTFSECIALHIPLIDVRYSATSNDKRYGGEAIKARSGIIYHALPALGNRRYRENLNGSFVEPIIEIADLEAGLDALHSVMLEYGKVAIFCACSSPGQCHRRIVAEEAHNLFGWEIVHLPVKRRK
jgi:hypothetical protein